MGAIRRSEQFIGTGTALFEAAKEQQIVFFFSSRRRHTRYWRDWSSDVCCSDLGLKQMLNRRQQLVGLDVTNDDQCGVVGRIIGVVVPLKIVERHRIQIAEPSNNGPVIGMAEIRL